MSNNNTGLGPVSEQNEGEVTMGWFAWIIMSISYAVFGAFFYTGKAVGATVRRSAGVPGATKRVAQATKVAGRMVWEVTKEGYSEARWVKPVVIEDAEEIK